MSLKSKIIIIANIKNSLYIFMGFPWWLNSKGSTCQCRRCEFNPWDGKTPWRRKWQPRPVFLPEKSYGQRSPAGYSPGNHKESDMTEWLKNNNNIYYHTERLKGIKLKYEFLIYKTGNWSLGRLIVLSKVTQLLSKIWKTGSLNEELMFLIITKYNFLLFFAYITKRGGYITRGGLS